MDLTYLADAYRKNIDALKVENAKLRASLDRAEAAVDLREMCSGLDAKLRQANLQKHAMFELLSQFRDNLHLHKHDAKVPVGECQEAPCQKVMKYAEKRKCDQCGGDEESYNGEWLCRKCNGMCG